VKAAVAATVDQNQGYYVTKARSVELLSPLLEPPEQFFQKHPWCERNSVACYVLVECEPKPGQSIGIRHRPLVVVIRDSGKLLPRDAGKLKVVFNGIDEPVVKETFGEEWLAKHPRPTGPEKP
jgi:hypothetical protein